MDIKRYLRCIWKDAGREYPYLDCWGLVRCVRAEMGLPVLPSFDHVLHSDMRGFTKAYRDMCDSCLTAGDPVPGAIAAVKRGGLCRHVGVVVESDSRLWVLESTPERPTITRVEKYRRRFDVEFLQ